MSQVKEGKQIVVCYYILFACFGIEREHHIKDLVTEEPIPEMAIKRTSSSVILFRHGGALLKIKWKDRETFPRGLNLGWPSRETQKLKELPAILFAVPIVSQEWVKQIEFH